MDNEISVLFDDNLNQMVVSSLQVADSFGKHHKHVLESIKKMTAENSALLNMFFETTYISSQNKVLPMYLMNRDGFSLLVMGFTGQNALEWKLKYIQAFNQMESKLNDPDYIIQRSLQILKARCEALTIENKQQQAHIEVLKPKADYCDIILNCKDCVTISQVAKDYGFTANHMNKYLHEQGVQYKVNKQWVLYSKHADKGYVESDTTYKEDRYGISHAYVNTKWTQKGRLFIYELLKENGILPLVER